MKKWALAIIMFSVAAKADTSFSLSNSVSETLFQILERGKVSYIPDAPGEDVLYVKQVECNSLTPAGNQPIAVIPTYTCEMYELNLVNGGLGRKISLNELDSKELMELFDKTQIRKEQLSPPHSPLRILVQAESIKCIRSHLMNYECYLTQN